MSFNRLPFWVGGFYFFQKINESMDINLVINKKS